MHPPNFCLHVQDHVGSCLALQAGVCLEDVPNLLNDPDHSNEGKSALID